MKTAILVTTHRPYWFPEDGPYLPVQVGAGFQAPIPSVEYADNQGDNIGEKNRTFCELTGLYWAWKNLDADVYGLCHYRRYMGNRRWWKPKKERLLKEKEIRRMLSGRDLILPTKRHYWIETIGSHYAHAHHIEDLQCVEEILSERYHEYLPDWQWMLGTRSGHICNMFIMRREQFNEYCAWLFDILFEAERRLDISSYSDSDRRVFGYLGELMLDVWVRKNGLRYTEAPKLCLERQHWIRKCAAFLGRKLKGSCLDQAGRKGQEWQEEP